VLGCYFDGEAGARVVAEGVKFGEVEGGEEGCEDGDVVVCVWRLGFEIVGVSESIVF
jgi:hypothetical protein